MTEPLFDISVGVASFFAGVLGSLIGIGGGIIITPLLVLGFGIDMRYAMGAALCSVIATSSPPPLVFAPGSLTVWPYRLPALDVAEVLELLLSRAHRLSRHAPPGGARHWHSV